MKYINWYDTCSSLVLQNSSEGGTPEVRAVYELTYDTIFAGLEVYSNSDHPTVQNFLIQGNPRIGTTNFLFYAFFHRVGNKLPTLLQLDITGRFVFYCVEAGAITDVSKIPPQYANSPDVWYLFTPRLHDDLEQIFHNAVQVGPASRSDFQGSVDPARYGSEPPCYVDARTRLEIMDSARLVLAFAERASHIQQERELYDKFSIGPRLLFTETAMGKEDSVDAYSRYVGQLELDIKRLLACQLRAPFSHVRSNRPLSNGF
jgi:hypothetical protein